ncbi:transposase [Amphibacillus jilinensis]|uniref:transposase n=1 Tax=Amphibacillus jilinensis TaxID=1216008 RepID=UPI0009FDA6D3
MQLPHFYVGTFYWALKRVRRGIQKEFLDYDRKKCKRMKHIFFKRYEELTDKQHWYLGLSEDLCTAYRLKKSLRC